MTSRLADLWAGKTCYLNGAPARVTGRLNAYATVTPVNLAVSPVMFSWHVVNRIMREGVGYFETR